MTVAPAPRPLTYSEYLTLPEDPRAQLVDGLLEVNAPSLAHQDACRVLADALRDVLPRDVKTYLSIGWFIDERNEPIPDVLVVPAASRGARFTGTPALAVEVLSGNRSVDLVTKRRLYASAGLPAYWLVDLDDPSVTALELQDGTYVEVACSTGEQSADLRVEGVVVTVRASDLLA